MYKKSHVGLRLSLEKRLAQGGFYVGVLWITFARAEKRSESQHRNQTEPKVANVLVKEVNGGGEVVPLSALKM